MTNSPELARYVRKLPLGCRVKHGQWMNLTR